MSMSPVNLNFEINELLRMRFESQRGDAENVHGNDRDDCKGDREIEVARGRAEKGSDLCAPDHDRAYPRQKAEPVREEDKEEDGGNERKIFFRLAAVAEYVIHKAERSFDDEFHEILEGVRDEPESPRCEYREGGEREKHERRHEERVRHGEVPDPKELLRLQ